MTTLADHWDELTKEEREYLLSKINYGKVYDQRVHMGMLPFISAEFAYDRINTYYIDNSSSLQQNLLNKLRKYRNPMVTTKDWQRYAKLTD